MKALYSRSFLEHIAYEDMCVAFKRYLFKLEHHRKEIAELKFHEKDFLFRALQVFYNATGDKRFNVNRIPELEEQLFYWVILLHSNMTMVFDGFVPGPNKTSLTPKEKRRNKHFFYEYLQVWKNQIDSGAGPYMSIIRPAIGRKLREWRRLAYESFIPEEELEQKEIFVYACFFTIYYHVKLFFDELSHPYLKRQINGIDVVFNIYSFVHIYNRHYIPNMNVDLGGSSMNPEIEFIDVDHLPTSILDLLERYNTRIPISSDTEYCLFTWNNSKFILWLKYKRLNETKSYGLEVRSFYKCDKESDLIKFNNSNCLSLI